MMYRRSLGSLHGLAARARRRRPWRLLYDERGIALILALGVMLVFTIALTAVVQFTSAGSRNSSLSAVGEKAYGVAEGGVSAGASVLAAQTRPDLWSSHPTSPGTSPGPATLPDGTSWY